MAFQQPYYSPFAYFAQPNYYQQNTALDLQNQQKIPYQQQMQPQPTQPFATPSQISNDFIWVQGEAGAKAYLVAPNNTVTLWDSESPTIYVKTADSSGVPSMRILDFTERDGAKPKEKPHVCSCGNKFAKIEDFKALEEKVESLQSELEAFLKPKKVKTVKETIENE